MLNFTTLRPYLITLVAVSLLFAMVFSIKGCIENNSEARAMKIQAAKNEATAKALGIEVKARDIIIARDSQALSNHLVILDSLSAENTRLRAYLTTSQKYTSNEITNFHSLPPTERLRVFSKLITGKYPNGLQ